MIKKLQISRLFDRFNYEIVLNKNRITILTGPNGFGKSTILKIITALSSADWSFFKNLSFQSINVEFETGNVVCIQRRQNIHEPKNKSILVVNGENLPDLLLSPQKHKNQIYHRATVLNQDHLKMEILLNLLESSVDFEKTVELIASANKEKQYKKGFETIKKISNECGGVRLISEQRLIKKDTVDSENEKIIDVIGQLPEKMKAQISKISADYSKTANELDVTYPQRLLSTQTGLKGEEEFLEKSQDANQKFEKLNKYDLADINHINLIKHTQYEEEFSKALKVYFDDFEKKYSVFSEFIKRLDLYTDIINSRLTFKSIRISRDDGLVVVDDKRNKRLKLEQLSSGEKQEIVLFYELIFETEKGLLLLVDEPEISLHIVWQKMFMEDLERVAKLCDLRAIIATHSPQIINNRWDLQIDLGELYGG